MTASVTKQHLQTSVILSPLPPGIGKGIEESSEFQFQDLLPKPSRPYIPTNANLAIDLNNRPRFYVSNGTSFIPHDVLVHIFTFLKDPKEMRHVSCVCKAFYCASKGPVIWNIFLKNIFPDLRFIPSEIFSQEHQFKIIYERVLYDQRRLEIIENKIKAQIHYLQENKDTSPPLNSEINMIYVGRYIKINVHSIENLKNALQEIEKVKVHWVSSYNHRGIFEGLIRIREMAASSP